MSGAHREFIEIYVRGGLRDVQNVQIRYLRKIHTYLSILSILYIMAHFICAPKILFIYPFFSVKNYI